MTMKRCRPFILLLLSLVLLAGCASFRARQISRSFERDEPCQDFFGRLDQKVDEAGVRDAGSARIPGFPYLRVNRFLAGLKNGLKDERQREQWLFWMQKLDLDARKREVRNLSEESVSLLMEGEGERPTREQLLNQLEACSSRLLSHDRERSDFYEILYPLVDVPDEYSLLMRTLGLYPLFALPVALATDSSRQKIRKRFDTDLNDLPIDGSLRSFVPEKSVSLNTMDIQEIIQASKRNPLGVPLPSEDQERMLVESFAPVFIQDVGASYDRLGRLVWKSERLEIDLEIPTVYYYVSHAFLKGEPILQINYVIWYSERAGERSPWIELGHLDGLTARVSLDAGGKPFMVDVVNDCGCYHFFAPDRERVERVLSKPFQFDPLVTQWLPEVPPGNRLGIRINSGWHQVQRLMAVGEAVSPISYALLPYDVLEVLPHENGRTQSIFDDRGIVKSSGRIERFILFSMGIPSVGSMRQRGHHATELIGRVHLDDPYLYDHNFIFK
jgi:hypothetical protein